MIPPVSLTLSLSVSQACGSYPVPAGFWFFFSFFSLYFSFLQNGILGNGRGGSLLEWRDRSLQQCPLVLGIWLKKENSRRRTEKRTAPDSTTVQGAKS